MNSASHTESFLYLKTAHITLKTNMLVKTANIVKRIPTCIPDSMKPCSQRLRTLRILLSSSRDNMDADDMH